MKRLLLFAASTLVLPGISFAAPPTTVPSPSQPVTVTNTPLPVTVQGGVTVGGAVTVGNTSDNPVPVVGAVVNAEETKLLYDQFLTLDKPDYRDNPQVGPIDVSAYKSVRVVLRLGSCGPCGATPPVAFVRTVGTATGEPRTIDKVPIDVQDGDIGHFASRLYDTPGTQLVISHSTAAGSNSTVRVMVFGRAN
jgi:hypothetical protein